MIRTLTALALVVLVSSTCLLADDPPKKTEAPPPKAKGFLPKNFKALGITDSQKDAIYKVQSQYGAKIDALKAQIRELQQQEAKEIYAVLTDAQKARLKEIRVGEDTKPADQGKKVDPPQ
jgi:hypothetical protein